jgi:hypothetical protein
MTDEEERTPGVQAAAPQAAESCIVEPTLPVHLKAIARDVDPDWNAKALEALANQLTEASDFYYPLFDAAQELRDLRSVHSALIELLRTVNPYTKPYITHVSPWRPSKQAGSASEVGPSLGPADVRPR